MRAYTVGALAAAVALAACGGSSKKEDANPDLTTFFPATGEVTGWSRNPAEPMQVRVGADAATQSGLNGEVAPYAAAGFVQVAYTGYVNAGTSETLEKVRIWQLTDAAAAQALWTSILTTSYYTASTFGPCATSVGESCRMAESQLYYRFNARKGAYYVEAFISPKSAEAPGRALTFLAALVAKLP